MQKRPVLFGLALLVAGAAAILLVGGLAQAAGAGSRFVPIGAAYEEDTLLLFAEQAIAYDNDGVVTIRVLLTTYPTDPYTITAQERAENLELAEERAGQIQDACLALVVTPTTCLSTAPDIQLRADAENAALVAAALGSDVDGIYILGGDQTIGMYVMANTPLEDALETLVTGGVPLSGNSAGAAVQSRYMIGGYADWAYAWHGLEQDALLLWYAPTTEVTRGLRFGIEEAIIDQHVLERGRLARLLQAAEQSPGGKIGLGVDWGTGVVIENRQLVTETTGWYAAVVLDEETYGSAAAAQYLGPRNTLSIHDVAFHVLPAGPYGYDLAPSVPVVNGASQAAPNITGRNFNFLRGPAGSGSLMLSGDISDDPTGPIASHFATLAEATNQPTVVLAAGFISETEAAAAADGWATDLGSLGVSQVQTAVLTETTDLNALAAQLAAAGAIFVTGNDQPTIVERMAQLTSLNLHELWHEGKVILLDNAAAAAAGAWMSNEPTPTEDDVEYQSSDSFVVDYIAIGPGLGLIPNAVFEPRALYDYLYGRLVSHVYQHDDVVAFGLERNTALEITPAGVTVLGESAIFAIDGRYAELREAGTNDIMALTWLLIDTYAPGDNLVAAPTGVGLSQLSGNRSLPLQWFWLAAAVLGLAVLALKRIGRHFV